MWTRKWRTKSDPHAQTIQLLTHGHPHAFLKLLFFAGFLSVIPVTNQPISSPNPGRPRVADSIFVTPYL
jgi:hypothetical protein